MSTPADNSWMPSIPDSHPLVLGGSLRRAIKARSGPVAPPKVARDFFSFRCGDTASLSRHLSLHTVVLVVEDNFLPESSASTLAGTVEVKKGDSNNVTVEHPSTHVRRLEIAANLNAHFSWTGGRSSCLHGFSAAGQGEGVCFAMGRRNRRKQPLDRHSPTRAHCRIDLDHDSREA